MTSKPVVTIAGNVGVGKSTLTELLAESLGWTPFFEAVDDNPYLPDFYRNMQQWSFHSQTFFLSRRLRYHREILAHPNPVIQDRCIYEDAEIFAHNLYQQGSMTDRDYALYRDLYEEFIHLLPPPALMVYLKASVPTLISRIQRRGRSYEQDMSSRYLEQLNKLYDQWIEGFTLCPILVISADQFDFVRDDRHFEELQQMIVEKLAEAG